MSGPLVIRAAELFLEQYAATVADGGSGAATQAAGGAGSDLSSPPAADHSLGMYDPAGGGQ